MANESEAAIEEIAASYAFRDTLVDRADRHAAHGQGAPLWHGWALHEAFMAGVRWERERQKGQPAPASSPESGGQP